MLFLIIFSVSVCFVGAMPVPDITTPSSLTDFTTEDYEKTDLPQEQIDEALNIDDGRYTTQLFQYQNAQKEKIKGDYNDTCIDSYINCVMNQVAPIEVCAFNHGFGELEHRDPAKTGYWNAASYCDVQLDNCRRGYRVWRIFAKGFCKKKPNRWRIYGQQIKPGWGPRPVWKD